MIHGFILGKFLQLLHIVYTSCQKVDLIYIRDGGGRRINRRDVFLTDGQN